MGHRLRRRSVAPSLALLLPRLAPSRGPRAFSGEGRGWAVRSLAGRPTQGDRQAGRSASQAARQGRSGPGRRGCEKGCCGLTGRRTTGRVHGHVHVTSPTPVLSPPLFSPSPPSPSPRGAVAFPSPLCLRDDGTRKGARARTHASLDGEPPRLRSPPPPHRILPTSRSVGRSPSPSPTRPPSVPPTHTLPSSATAAQRPHPRASRRVHPLPHRRRADTPTPHPTGRFPLQPAASSSS